MFAALTMSLGEILIAVIIILGLFAIVYIASKAMGVPIPQWLIQIIGVVLIVIVAVFAI